MNNLYHIPHKNFLKFAILITLFNSCFDPKQEDNTEEKAGVAVLLIDTDRIIGNVHEEVYGQFLEHINHSVVDGLYAEQIRGQGFEGTDFETYWNTVENSGEITLETVNFKNGQKSVRLNATSGIAGIRQDRLFIKEGIKYNGSLWIKPETGSPKVNLKILDSGSNQIIEQSLKTSETGWQEVRYDYTSTKTDVNASIEISTDGNILLDFISMMSADSRKNGMLRVDLVQALCDLNPPFIRWPGGSFASIYKWKDGIGPQVSRTYHPNEIWGGYSDYYGFGTDEFLELCRQLNSKPMIVLSATSTDPTQVQYAMDWVHYLMDPPTTEWGKLRAENGHHEPYEIPYFQIDNEPMNHGLSPDQYAEIVNVFGTHLRKIAPHSEIVACGQKRSNDMIWSEKLIDLAGENFDILGCHNYEYEPENFQTGVQRIEDYLIKLRDYIRTSQYPNIKPAVLEWGSCRSYDWRAGLHAAGSLISYEKLGIEMACPALLMRNTSDDPTWTAWIYHDHTSWFPGGGYIVEKLFHEHYTPNYLASTSGTFSDLDDRTVFFDDISQMKPEDWQPGTIDAIATCSTDGNQIVIKAVNYTENKHILLTRLQGSSIPKHAIVKTYIIKARPNDAASLEEPDVIQPEEETLPFETEMIFEMDPFSVLVTDILAIDQ